MRISGTKPSSVILSKVKLFLKKVAKWYLKVAENTEAKSDGVINPRNYIFSQF